MKSGINNEEYKLVREMGEVLKEILENIVE